MTVVFDPDKFVLSKQDFLGILNRIGSRWQKNMKDNWKIYLELQGVKAYVLTKSDNTIRKIWTEVLHEFNEILIENSIAIDKDNEYRLLTTFEKLRDHGTKFK